MWRSRHPLQVCFHRMAVRWALRAYLPSGITTGQLMAMHPWAAVAPQVLSMRQTGHPTQLGCPVCLLLGLQSLWLWTHSGPNSNSCLFSPLLVLLKWITHRNSFLGKSILGHTLFSFARDAAFPESVDTGKRLGHGMWGALCWANFMSGRENFFFSSSIKLRYILNSKKKWGENGADLVLVFVSFSTLGNFF